MALGLVHFDKIFSWLNFFLNILWDIDLKFCMWLYLDEVQFKSEDCFDPAIVCLVMTLRLVYFGKISVVRIFISLWDIDLIFCMWLYLDNLKTVPVQWWLAQIWPLDLYTCILVKFSVVETSYNILWNI